MITKEGNRLLAAIMFTDMVGYTALMQENEKQAKINRDRHRDVLIESTERHAGKILQYYGDGTLIIFNSSIEAVWCAIEVQEELQKEPRIPLRIGLHTGDIVYDEEGIYGDGVNVASRIESLAAAGSILISDKLFDDIKNQPRCQFKSLGSFDLKNVKHPVEVYAIANDGLTVPGPGQVDRRRKERVKSIAVLPFVNMSSDPENEYFSDGITEELLNALSKVEGLQVTARTSSFAFKGKNLDIREIGKELNVRTVLEGSVRKAGNRVRVTAQLINTIDGYHIWAETYDRQLDDIFELQDEISSIISNRLREKLSDQTAKEKLVVPATQDLDAYNIYLKGLFYQYKWSLEDSRTAIELFNKAIDIDAEYALVFAALSGVYGFLGATGKMSAKMAYPKSKEFALKAMELDDGLSETYLALANVEFWMEWNWKEAITHVNKAIKLNPSYAAAYLFKAIFLTAFGRTKEALANVKLSLELDPFSPPSSYILSLCYFMMGEYERASAQLEKTLKIDRHFSEAINMKGWFAKEKGDFQAAIKALEEAQTIPGNEWRSLASLGGIYARKGDVEIANEILIQLLEIEEKKPEIDIAFYIAMLYVDLEEIDKMFHYLNKSMEAREGSILHINSFLPFRRFHSDSRYIQIIEKMGLPVPDRKR
ncbi:MAG: tetratricopeptide repeat protein [bacterium]|nr:tetratricopeptide repeat protein [bacterium]